MPAHKRSGRPAALALALLVTTFTSPAMADPIGGGHANIKSMSFNATPLSTTLQVTSSDGQKWDTIKSGNMVIQADMDLDTRWPGYTYETAIVLGACGGALCNSFPSIFFEKVSSRDYHKTTNVAFDATEIPVSTTGIAILPHGDQIIARCNENLQADGPTKKHSFTYEMWATFVANTGSYINNTDNILHEVTPDGHSGHPEGVDHSRKDTFDIQVVCEPVMKPATNDLSFDLGPFEIENMKLFLTTITPLNPTGANPGTICPVLKVTARAETNKEGPVTMRIWEQLNGGPITSKVEQAWAEFDAAENTYYARYAEHKNFGVTTHAQYRAEVIDANDPFPPFDGWKTISVHCTGAGGGGLATTPPADPDAAGPLASWGGEIIVADSAGSDRSCPRQAQAFFAVSRAQPGSFTYRISCSNGKLFTGTATAFDQGNGIFEAYGAHDFSITRTRAVQCTLQEITSDGAAVTVDTAKTDFVCANPAIDPASNDITVAPKPQTRQPKKPSVVVIPQPKCSRGLVFRNGRCYKAPKTSPQRPPTSSNPVVVAPRPTLECRHGLVKRNGKCVRLPTVTKHCKRGEALIRGRCVKKPAVSILCSKGYKLVRGKCVKAPSLVQRCKRNETLVRGQCVPRPTVKPRKPRRAENILPPRKERRVRPTAPVLKRAIRKLQRR